jgi:hypothetical protein
MGSVSWARPSLFRFLQKVTKGTKGFYSGFLNSFNFWACISDNSNHLKACIGLGGDLPQGAKIFWSSFPLELDNTSELLHNPAFLDFRARLLS